jgi:hypothetical protein
MADKQNTMPLVPIPAWANDDLINDPGEPWDSTDTKVEPGAGKRDDGFLPEENPPAQHVNKLFHEIGTWLQYFSTIQVQNLQSLGDGLVVQQVGTALVYDEGIRSWVCGGRSGGFTYSSDSQTWATPVITGSGFTEQWAATKREADAPAHVGQNCIFGTNSNLAMSNLLEWTAGGGFTVHNLMGGPGDWRSTHGIWDPFNSRWIIGGVGDTLGTPNTVFWYASTPIGAITTVVPTSVNSVDVVMIAVGDPAGSGLLVAVGDNAPFDVWTSTDGGTSWSQATPSGITAGEGARAIVWDPARQLFVLTTDNECYTSTNGTAWSLVGTTTANGFQTRCLATDEGGLYVAGDLTGDIPRIRYSVDGGVSWRVVPAPKTEWSPAGDIYQVAYSRIAKRFMISTWNGDPTDAGHFSVTLAAGETIWDANNNLTQSQT